MCANLAMYCSASSGIRMVAAICELSDNTNCDMDQLAKIWGGYMEDFTKSYVELAKFGDGPCMEMGACLGAIQCKSWFNPLTTDDTFGVIGFWLHVISWHNPQGDMGGCTALADSA